MLLLALTSCSRQAANPGDASGANGSAAVSDDYQERDVNPTEGNAQTKGKTQENDYGLSSAWDVQARYPTYYSSNYNRSGWYVTNNGELFSFESSDGTVKRTQITSNVKAVYAHGIFLDNDNNLILHKGSSPYSESTDNELITLAANVADFNQTLILCNDGRVLCAYNYYMPDAEVYEVLQDGAYINHGGTDVWHKNVIVSKSGDFYTIQNDSFSNKYKATKKEDCSGVVYVAEEAGDETNRGYFLSFNETEGAYYGWAISGEPLLISGSAGKWNNIVDDNMLNDFLKWRKFTLAQTGYALDFTYTVIGTLGNDGNWFARNLVTSSSTLSYSSEQIASNVKQSGSASHNDWYLTNDGKFYWDDDAGQERNFVLKFENVNTVLEDNGSSFNALFLLKDGRIIDKDSKEIASNVRIP